MTKFKTPYTDTTSIFLYNDYVDVRFKIESNEEPSGETTYSCEILKVEYHGQDVTQIIPDDAFEDFEDEILEEIHGN